MAALSQPDILESLATETWGVTEPRVRAKVKQLVSAYQPVRVVAFGSWARGEAGPDSDLDLAVIVDDAADETIHVRGTEPYIPMSVDVVVARKSRHKLLATALASVHYDIAHEGIVLYERENNPAFYGEPSEEDLRLSKLETLAALLRLAQVMKKP